MTGPTFQGLNTLLLMTIGSGTLSHISYQTLPGVDNVLQAKSITAMNETRWVLGFSYYFQKYAFIWEGEGEATYRVGDSVQTVPVGRSWNNATIVTWNSPVITNGDVSPLATGTFGTDPIAWVVPPPL